MHQPTRPPTNNNNQMYRNVARMHMAHDIMFVGTIEIPEQTKTFQSRMLSLCTNKHCTRWKVLTLSISLFVSLSLLLSLSSDVWIILNNNHALHRVTFSLVLSIENIYRSLVSHTSSTYTTHSFKIHSFHASTIHIHIHIYICFEPSAR